MKKSNEMNKSLITGVNIDTLLYKSNKQMDIIYPSKNAHISYGPETKDPNYNSIFNKNKTSHTFVTEYECISDKNDGNKKGSISYKLDAKEPFNIDEVINLTNDNYGKKGKNKNIKIEKKKKKRNKNYSQEEKREIQIVIEEEEKNIKKKKRKKSSKKKKEKKYKDN